MVQALCWKKFVRWVHDLSTSRAPLPGEAREKAALPARPDAARGEDEPVRGEELLLAVTYEMVAFHQRYHHRVPVTAKTLLVDDELMICVMGGVYTDVEKTMIEVQRSGLVRDARSAFQNAMEGRLIAAVERLSGRRVLTFMSDHHVGPDIEIELFFLAPTVV